MGIANVTVVDVVERCGLVSPEKGRDAGTDKRSLGERPT
jgi:hypothetical protein